MMKKILKYILGLAALFLVAYNSVYFKRLDEVKASASKAFDAEEYARDYFDKKLIPAMDSTVQLDQLLVLLNGNPAGTFDKYSHALGIGNIRYFLVKGEGAITSIDENDVTIQSNAGASPNIYKIATEFVYGNEIRDASGLISLNEFNNTADFNSVSAAINKIVRTEVLPTFKKRAKKGNAVQFVGAIELNKEHLNTGNIEIIPISLKLNNEK